MGSSNSRMKPPPSKSKMKRRFSSLFCGSSTSHSPSQGEDYPQKLPINSVENISPISNVAPTSITESSSISASHFTSSEFEKGSSSEISDGTVENTFLENGSQNNERNSHEARILKSKESVSQPVSSDCNCVDAYKEQPSQDSITSNSTAGSVAPIEAHDSPSGSSPLICPDHQNSTHMDSPENPRDSVNNSESGSVLVISDTVLSLQLRGNDTPRTETALSSGSRILLSGGEVHVDVVSISSNVLSSSVAEISNREARRNSRRLFWDALSRHSFRRYRDSPTIVFTTGMADELGSHDRWLLDLSGDLRYDGLGHDFDYPGGGSLGFGFGSRSRNRYERRRALRSEMSERGFGGLDERDRTSFCASGLHPNGTCSCESYFMTEETSALASISRIVMLAEALFEVLDEIHRQPLSLSLSMLSLPAPESVVDSFPLKNHKKIDASERGHIDVQQCYICLAEYEEGDKVRVLPCHHEYHMLCVDKWLKEINRVCPVCRSNVCEGGEQGSSVSNPETPVQ